MNAVNRLAPDQLPNSVEAEQQILGALLLNNSLMEKVDGILSADAFYDPLHGRIYEAISSRIDAGQLASPVTIKAALEADPALAEVGGPKYLVRMAGAASSTYAIADYAQLVMEAAAKRGLLSTMDDAGERIKMGAESIVSIAEAVETAAGSLLSKSKVKPLIRSHLSAITGAVTEVNEAYRGDGPIGVSTGLPQLDRKLGNLRPTNLIILAGRPGMGKTTVAQNVAYSAASAGVGVFFASLEMSSEDLGKRFLSKGLAERGTELPYNRMINGRLSEAEMRQIIEEAKRQESLPLITGERDVRKLSRLRAAARRAQQNLSDGACPLGLIVVDYVQRVAADTQMNMRERVSEATDMLKSLAMEMNVPVLALAQLSREVEKRDNKIPMLSDLKESGSLEEDADAVLFCYRHAYYLQKELDGIQGSEKYDQEADLRHAINRCSNDIDIIVGKQRSGPEGSVRAYIDPGLCHITQDRSQDEGHLI